MNRINYRMTFTAKVLIIKLLICLAGLLSGFTWRTYIDNHKWEALIYPSVEVAGVALGGKTLDEGKSLLEATIINPKMEGSTNILVNGKIYTIENSQLIMGNTLESVAKDAFNYGKNLTASEKKQQFDISKNIIKNFDIYFTPDEDFINSFVEKLREEVKSSPKSASIFYNDDGTLFINPDKKGQRLNEQKLVEDIKLSTNNLKENNTIEAQLDEIPAEITEEMVRALNTKISSYKTTFNTALVGRSNNIKLASRQINGKIIQPGETFSFNQVVGERTRERGFMEAPVIMGNSFDVGIGGGICQLSSTLYNAVLRTGISSVERIHHTLPSDYVPIGLDATVDWNNLDYKFTNTLEYPIYIQSFIQGNTLETNIYSNSKLGNKEFSVFNDIYEVVETNTEFIDNPNLEQGQTLVTKRGYPGYKVRVLRNTIENGAVIKTETISDDYYHPVSQVVSVGMKAEK